MRVAPTGYLPYLYRSDPIRALFYRGHGFAFFCPHREWENRCHWDATDPTTNNGVSLMGYFAAPYRKVKTLIPIARLPSMTAWHRPAVSSLEACKTSAR
jgi:hypothetical protein